MLPAGSPSAGSEAWRMPPLLLLLVLGLATATDYMTHVCSLLVSFHDVILPGHAANLGARDGRGLPARHSRGCLDRAGGRLYQVASRLRAIPYLVSSTRERVLQMIHPDWDTKKAMYGTKSDTGGPDEKVRGSPCSPHLPLHRDKSQRTC